MGRLIDADALKGALIELTPYAIDPVYRNQNSDIDMFTVIDIIDDAPTIDPVQGEWIVSEFGHKCSACNEYVADEQYEYGHKSFCGNCGADMRCG